MICTIKSNSGRYFKVFTGTKTNAVFVDETDESGNVIKLNYRLAHPVESETQDDCFFTTCRKIKEL